MLDIVSSLGAVFIGVLLYAVGHYRGATQTMREIVGDLQEVIEEQTEALELAETVLEDLAEAEEDSAEERANQNSQREGAPGPSGMSLRQMSAGEVIAVVSAEVDTDTAKKIYQRFFAAGYEIVKLDAVLTPYNEELPGEAPVGE